LAKEVLSKPQIGLPSKPNFGPPFVSKLLTEQELEQFCDRRPTLMGPPS
jgi:hypothetical protein